uniref:mRNA decay activator protein ZFP36 n=1 Tax=Kryptolebias marmoratus TaxID=37003 RepID=A0A3Q3AV27_KRYMA
MNTLHISSLLDQKAVGSPVSAPGPGSFTPGIFRRNSTSNLEALTRFSLGSCGGTMENKAPGGNMNKENRFRDRAYSETGDRGVLQQKPGSQINSTRYKTELCRPFEENGSCKYGEKCQFAHGYHELRSLTRHPKYKTEPCRTFHTIGFCPYGPRCHFIHNAEERRPAPLSNANLQAVREVQQTPYTQRPKLHHSFSFSGFSTYHGLDSPMSRTSPPPSFYNELLSPGSELLSPGSVVLSPSSTFSFPAPLALRSPVSEPPPSPPDSFSDRDSFGSSSSSGSLSGSESPTLDPGRRLPIFSRLSISDD